MKRRKELFKLLIKHGRAELSARSGLNSIPPADDAVPNRSQEEHALEVARDLEQLGPTFIKLGQLLSTRADLLPPAYLKAMSRLQDDVAPFPFSQVKGIIERELQQGLHEAYKSFDPEPIATASLGQVHRAVLHSGRDVVVKVQRPNIREGIIDDFEILTGAAELVEKYTDFGERYRLRSVIRELRGSVINELDYQQEVHNFKILKRNLAAFEYIFVPEAIEALCTSKVLTMDFVPGVKVTEATPEVLAAIDGPRLVEELFNAYLKGFLIDGFFHADPHPGNIILTPGGRLALIDLGMVGWFTPSFRSLLVKLLLAISEGRGDDAAEVCIRMGEPGPEFQRSSFVRRAGHLVTRHRDANVRDIDAGRVVLEIMKIAGATDLMLPESLTLMSKALLNLDKAGHFLAPQFSPNEAIRKQSTKILEKRALNYASVPRMFGNALETIDFLETLPNRADVILERLAKNEFRLDVDAIDEARLLRGMHKIANRITAGLVLAALIIGAALIMNIESSVTIMGYPAFALFLFTVAVAWGLLLVHRILFSDAADEKKARRKRY